MNAPLAVARRAFAQARVMTAAFGVLFGAYAAANVVGYRTSYPHLADRIDLARSFGANSSLRLLYGTPRTLLTVDGYVGWRVGGFLAVVAAILGMVLAVRALRSEEEAGRLELVLAGRITRGGAFAAACAAIAAAFAAVALATLAGLVAAGVGGGGSAYLAVVIASSALVFAGVGAVASQTAPTRRGAYTVATLALGTAFLLRVAADTGSGLGWMRWLTPLGWSEEARALTDPRPAVMILPAAATVLLVGAAAVIAERRDVGTALFAPRDAAPPRFRLLGSVAAAALRDEAGSLIAWFGGMGIFAFVVGSLSGSIEGALSQEMRRRLNQIGGGRIATPSGFLALYFVFFVLAVSIFFCAQLAAARREEADQRLETLLALPVSRIRWLGSRLALALLAGLALALEAGVLAWAGARANGVDVALTGTVKAGLNIMPTSMLFLGVATLLVGLLPRASTGVAYGLVGAAFTWELVGAVLGAPAWTLDASPFHHVGLVPIRPYPAAAAAVMLAIGLAAAAVGVRAFVRRDLTSA